MIFPPHIVQLARLILDMPSSVTLELYEARMSVLSAHLLGNGNGDLSNALRKRMWDQHERRYREWEEQTEAERGRSTLARHKVLICIAHSSDTFKSERLQLEGMGYHDGKRMIGVNELRKMSDAESRARVRDGILYVADKVKFHLRAFVLLRSEMGMKGTILEGTARMLDGQLSDLPTVPPPQGILGQAPLEPVDVTLHFQTKRYTIRAARIMLRTSPKANEYRIKVEGTCDDFRGCIIHVPPEVRSEA